MRSGERAAGLLKSIDEQHAAPANCMLPVVLKSLSHNLSHEIGRPVDAEELRVQAAMVGRGCARAARPIAFHVLLTSFVRVLDALGCLPNVDVVALHNAGDERWL